MEKNSKIYVAGHTGLVGSAITRKLKEKGYSNLLLKDISELDLTNQHDTADFLRKEKPEYVILAAAKVGGIIANNTYRADFLYVNLQIQNNIIHHSYLNGVKKLLFLGSSCIYPKDAPQPLREEYLLTSPLEYTNEPYAIAKIAGIKMCESYNIQYGTNFISVMPTNLYGPNDNYDLEKSHVLPALIRKMHLGKCLEKGDWNAIRKDFNKRPVEGINGNAEEKEIEEKLKKYGVVKPDVSNQALKESSVTLWGTGSVYREFLHSDDMADACIFLMERSISRNTHINIGCGVDQTINELAHVVKEIIGFKGIIIWDSSKPDGTLKKLLDVSKLNQLGWKQKIKLKEGITNVYNNYIL